MQPAAHYGSARAGAASYSIGSRYGSAAYDFGAWAGAATGVSGAALVGTSGFTTSTGLGAGVGAGTTGSCISGGRDASVVIAGRGVAPPAGSGARRFSGRRTPRRVAASAPGIIVRGGKGATCGCSPSPAPTGGFGKGGAGGIIGFGGGTAGAAGRAGGAVTFVVGFADATGAGMRGCGCPAGCSVTWRMTSPKPDGFDGIGGVTADGTTTGPGIAFVCEEAGRGGFWIIAADTGAAGFCCAGTDGLVFAAGRFPGRMSVPCASSCICFCSGANIC